MSVQITVQNKLEILPGHVIRVPGCEPVTSLTSTALSRNLDCNASIIPVEDALRLIPGSRIVRVLSPFGQTGTGMFLELPNGPPHTGNLCPSDCITDWYAILKENATTGEAEDEAGATPACSGFNYSGCVFDYNPVLHPRDPSLRPNDNPLGNL